MVEPVPAFSLPGARMAIQIGMCGGLQPELTTGVVVLPRAAIARRAVAALYCAGKRMDSSVKCADRAEMDFVALEFPACCGINMSRASPFAQTGEMCRRWNEAGYPSAEMQAAATFGVARQVGVPAVSMPVTWARH